jgi:hypothetical protein
VDLELGEKLSSAVQRIGRNLWLPCVRMHFVMDNLLHLLLGHRVGKVAVLSVSRSGVALSPTPSMFYDHCSINGHESSQRITNRALWTF